MELEAALAILKEGKPCSEEELSEAYEVAIVELGISDI